MLKAILNRLLSLRNKKNKHNGHSYMALHRFERGFIQCEPFEPKAVLKSGLADQTPLKTKKGLITFYGIESLEQAKGLLHN